MRCPNCGQDLLPRDKFCANCGAPAPLEPSSYPFEASSSQTQTNPPPVDYRPQQQTAAAKRSFLTEAIITFVCYLVFWFPGLIINLVYLREANQVERTTGRAPSGKGCLLALLVVFGLLPVLSGCLVAFVVLGRG
ncbi:MAG: zinc-ribbon domain-containing protein [Thermomicrobiales bacterium]